MASTITVICFLLFVAYSMSLFVRHQPHMVALAHFVANGCIADVAQEAASNVWKAALLGTLLGIIPALFLLHALHFPIRMKGMAFLPSYVVLGLMTGICPSTVDATENDIPVLGAAILLLVSVAAVLYSHVYHEDRGEHAPFTDYLGTNVLQACVGMMFCMALTNTDRQLHLQQPLAQAVLHRDNALAHSIPWGETTTNNTITALRALSLSRQGQMADKLFSIRGLQGSHSLLPDSTPSALIYHTPQLVYDRLHAVPIGFHGDVATFLQKAVERRETVLRDSTATRADSIGARPLMDYYLCALLLDRDLPSFAKALPRFYDPKGTLPRHYREALALYYAEDASATRLATDTVMDSIYHDYTQLMLSAPDHPLLQQKACTRAYPSSYWNYYHFAKARRRR